MNQVKKMFLLIMCLFFVVTSIAKEKRNLLTDFYTRKLVYESLNKDHSWINYPAYNDRQGWNQPPLAQKENTIKEGEKYLGYEWPTVTATMYLEFTRTGNRGVVDAANSSRQKALQTLCMAELIEGKGRFMDDLINGVFSICEQTYWGSSAHFYLYGFNGSVGNPITTLPDMNDPIIDLVVGDTAADLAWIWYFFHQEFDKVSPIISIRLKNEIKSKVLEPFYSRYDFWWITGWDEGRVNNWTPWCNFNMLTCILLVEDDPEKKEAGVYKTMQSVDLFINSYPLDGGCDEGPSYWGVAGGKLFDYLDLLKRNTNGKINIFGNELIKDMGRYIFRVYTSKGDHYINFADSPFRIIHDPSRIFRYGKSIEDPEMAGFGSFLMKKSIFGTSPVVGRIGEKMESLFNSKNWENTEPIEPLVSDFYFPNLDIAIGRDKAGTTNGFYFSAKGGSNGEGHNHNDVGSFMLYYNGDPVLIDVGVGTYTRETFSTQRYNIWTMQSNYHNVPLINGFAQSPGGKYKAINSKFDAEKKRVSYVTDIALSYPSEAKVEKWIRSYSLERGKKFTINDNFKLIENLNGTAFHFMTTLSCRVLKPGIVEFTGDGFSLQMNYNPSALNAAIEPIKVDDKKIIDLLGDKLSRIVFQLNGSILAGNVTFELKEVN